MAGCGRQLGVVLPASTVASLPVGAKGPANFTLLHTLRA